MSTTIPNEIYESLQGILPSVIGTVSEDRVPNVTYISQAHFVDSDHLAISWQFFNKTWRNIQKNKKFSIVVTSPSNWSMWKIDLSLEKVLKEGDLFEEMEIALEAIATMQGAEEVFKLEAILLCKVESIENQFDGLKGD